MSLQCQDRISTEEVKLCRDFSVFRLSLTCYIDIVISWCRKKYNSSRIQTSPPNNFSIIKSLFEDVTDVNVKLQIGLLYISNIFYLG